METPDIQTFILPPDTKCVNLIEFHMFASEWRYVHKIDAVCKIVKPITTTSFSLKLLLTFFYTLNSDSHRGQFLHPQEAKLYEFVHITIIGNVYNTVSLKNHHLHRHIFAVSSLKSLSDKK